MPPRNKTSTAKTASRNKKSTGTTTQPYDSKKEVRAIARERVGPVKAGAVIIPKKERKKPKHKKPLLTVSDE